MKRRDPAGTAADRPSAAQVETELRRERYRLRYVQVLRSTVFTLITAAAAAILIATLWMPVLQIYGASMQPALGSGEIVAAVKNSAPRRGDVVAFYYNNKILVKRVIGCPGSWIDIDEAGTVYVDGQELSEPYLTEKAKGECSIELPYQVPDGRYFVMGDQRGTSVDSRSTVIGCVAEEQLIGRVVFRLWPVRAIGRIR